MMTWLPRRRSPVPPQSSTPNAHEFQCVSTPEPPPPHDDPPVEWCSFVGTYGRFIGPTLVAVVLSSALWTLLLLVINVAPTWTIDRLLATTAVDDGDFWLLRSPDPAATGVVVAALALVALYYLYLLYLLAWRRKNAATVDDEESESDKSCATCLCDLAKQHFGELDVQARPILKVSEELPEIAYQTLLVHVFMATGVPPSWVLSVAALVALNCCVRSYRVLAREAYHEQHDSLVNAVFQFTFAVLLPAVQLLHATAACTFDRQLYALRVKHFAVGSFERLARFAQPEAFTSTHAVARTLVNTAVLANHGGLAIAAIGLHVSFLWRVHDVILASVYGFKRQRLPTRIFVSSSGSFLNLLRVTKTIYGFLIKLLLACVCVSKTLLHKLFSLLLFVYGVGVLVVVAIGVSYSARACEVLASQCALQAHEFNGFTMEHYRDCACLVFVSQPTAVVTSWSQWTSREDATMDLKAAARGKRLQVIQIVDRNVQELPDAVAHCEELRVVVLVRTNLHALPTWLVDMTELQVLHVAGDFNSTITQFPLETEFFASMKRLRILRLEDLATLTALPVFDEALTNQLESVALINLPLVTTVPVVSHLHGLHTLVLNQLPRLQRLPLFPPNLRTLRVEMPTALCCNGYLGGCRWAVGDASSSALAHDCSAAYLATNASATCLSSDTQNDTQTERTLEWLRASAFSCASDATVGHTSFNRMTQSAVAACDGEPFRQCSLTWPMFPDNVTGGMCVGHTRLQILHCVAKDSRYEALRRDEIQETTGRGHCDAIAEEWLGC